jgi:hypothetical protein
MDKVQKLSNSECYTPSSEPIRIYFCNRYGPGIYPSFRKFERLKILLAKTLNYITFLMRCKAHVTIPKGCSIKTPINSRRSSKTVQQASKALVRDRIHFHSHNKISLLQKIQKLEEFIKSSVSNSDQVRIFTAVESSHRNILNKQKATHIRKFSLLYNQQNKVSSTSASDSNKFILNFSKHVLTDS